MGQAEQLDWQTLYQTACDACKAGDLESAKNNLREAILILSSQDIFHRDLVACVFKLAQCFDSIWAEKGFTTTVFDDDPLFYAAAVSSIAVGRPWQEAFTLRELAVRFVAGTARGPGSMAEKACAVMVGLARERYLEGSHELSRSLFERALASTRNAFGNAHFRTMAALQAYAETIDDTSLVKHEVDLQVERYLAMKSLSRSDYSKLEMLVAFCNHYGYETDGRRLAELCERLESTVWDDTPLLIAAQLEVAAYLLSAQDRDNDKLLKRAQQLRAKAKVQTTSG